MNTRLAFLESNNKILLQSYNKENELHLKTIEPNELKDNLISGIIINQSLADDQDTLNLAQSFSKFFPVAKSQECGLSQNSFETLNEQDTASIFQKINSSWVLKHNLNLISNMSKVTDNLKSLWPNERTAFFEEFWFLLKNNFGLQNCILFFNDVLIEEKNERKTKKLIKVKISGNQNPSPEPGGDLADQLMSHYKNQFQEQLSVAEYNTEERKVVLAGSRNESPVLIMGEAGSHINKIQEACLHGIAQSLFTF